MTSNNTLKDVYLNRVSAFLPNAPVGNDEMEAVSAWQAMYRHACAV